MEHEMSFLEKIATQPLLADGAMGTLLYSRGLDFEACFDALNLSKPDVVSEVHRLYASAGADVLETNTFGANSYKLEHHGLASSLVDINARGVEIARQAARDINKNIYIAGSVGPLGIQLSPLGPVKLADAYTAFHEQVSALADAGADLIILETFSDINEIEQAVLAAKAACNLPVIAQVTFTRDNSTTLGYEPRVVALRLIKSGVDVIGANCSTGPRRMLDVIAAMHEEISRHSGGVPYLSAMPNAGFPEVRAERLMYPASPEYFAEYTRRFVEYGVRLVGGCCGTTPSHIHSMRVALDELYPAMKESRHFPAITARELAEETAPTQSLSTRSSEEPTQLALALQSGKFVTTVEIEPPKSSDTESIEATARTLKDAGVAVLDIADSPMARMRMSGLAVAHRVQERAGVETILHFPVRGRNLLRIQGDLLAAHALNIRNVLVIMGDPTRIGDYPQANDHHDIVPTGLAQLIKDKFNHGMDSAGSSIGRPCSFLVGMAGNLTPTDHEKEALLLHKKITCGADFVITQPVFDPIVARTFIDYYQQKYGALRLPIIVGILPLASVRHAEFMRNEVPGIVISDSIVTRLQNAGTKTRTEGALIAGETIAELREFVQGVYIIPAFGRFDFVARILQEIQGIL